MFCVYCRACEAQGRTVDHGGQLHFMLGNWDDPDWQVVFDRSLTEQEVQTTIAPSLAGDFSLESFVAALPADVNVVWMERRRFTRNSVE